MKLFYCIFVGVVKRDDGGEGGAQAKHGSEGEPRLGSRPPWWMALRLADTSELRVWGGAREPITA